MYRNYLLSSFLPRTIIPIPDYVDFWQELADRALQVEGTLPCPVLLCPARTGQGYENF
jgi:hypothetical protein